MSGLTEDGSVGHMTEELIYSSSAEKSLEYEEQLKAEQEKKAAEEQKACLLYTSRPYLPAHPGTIAGTAFSLCGQLRYRWLRAA